MTKLPIKHLIYINPPSYSTVKSYRPYLRESSNYSCTYCGISEAESSGATFNIDHFRPQALFSDLTTECSNLRYSCPRCNSYKSNNWISQEQGCIRDCSKCINKVCTQDIERFIDILAEDPSSVIYMDDDNKLYAYSNSKVANYTINYLRLNRVQLIRLRHIRRFMENWELQLKDKLTGIDNNLIELNKQYLEFTNNAHDKDSTHYNIIITMFQLLEKHYKNSKIFVEEELDKLSYLKRSMRGRDDNSLPEE